MRGIIFLLMFFVFACPHAGAQFHEQKIGVVLSGGAARGFAHLGALQALEEFGIVPSYVSGASMGAIIGSIYASGRSPKEIYDFARRQKYFRILSPSKIGAKGGLLKPTFIHHMLDQMIGHCRFELLQKKMFVAVTNLDLARSEIMDTGCLKTAVSASAAVPLIFEPIEINGYSYVDGGVLNNLPVEPLLGIEDCRYIIGISVISTPIRETRWKGTQPVVRALDMMVKSNEMESRAKCHFFLEIEAASDIKLTGFSHLDTLYQMGYRAMNRYISCNPDILRIVENQTCD
jgi:NTE family protein